MSLGDSNNDGQPEMSAETGNTYISETMRDAIKIPTANLGFTTIQSLKKVSASDCNSDRQQEIATWPRKPELLIYLRNYDRYSVEIPTAYLRFSTSRARKTVLGRLRQRTTIGNSNIDVFVASLLFWLFVVVAIT